MATTDEHRTIAPIVGPDDPRRFTDSGIEVKPLYSERTCRPTCPSGSASPASIRSRAGSTPTCTASSCGRCASTPATRAPRSPTSATGTCSSTARPACRWRSTCRPSSASTPTTRAASGEVGRTGVAIDTIDDMRTAFDGIPLDQVSTSMTINAPASVLLLLYELVGEEQGVAVRAAPRHDPERHPQGVHRPRQLHLPAGGRDPADDRPVRVLQRADPEVEHDLDQRLPLPREGLLGRPGGRVHARQRDRLRAGGARRRARGRQVRARGWRSSSTATTTSSRRSRSSAPPGGCGREIMRERFGAKDERSWRLRFHTQTGGVTLTAQQPENNIVRVALQGFAAVCGGTQSLHTNGFDEALALPTERAAKIALRTQQIIGYESGAADTVDPFAGSYFVEALTDEIETPRAGADRQGRRARRLGPGDRLHEERDRGVGVRLPRALPDRAGHRRRRQQVRRGRRSRCRTSCASIPQSEREQVERLKAFKADRDQELVGAAAGGDPRGRARHRATCCRSCARR